MIHFNCPTCRKSLQHARAGDRVTCPHCQQRIEVPAPPPRSRTVLGEWQPAKPEGTPQAPVAVRVLPVAEAVVPTPVVPSSITPSDLQSGDGQRRRRGEAHRATAILVLGILAQFTLPIILGPIAWVMANIDLRKMKRGTMDQDGQGTTEVGRVLGIIATVWSFGCACLLAVYFGLIIGILATSSTPDIPTMVGANRSSFEADEADEDGDRNTTNQEAIDAKQREEEAARQRAAEQKQLEADIARRKQEEAERAAEAEQLREEARQAKRRRRAESYFRLGKQLIDMGQEERGIRHIWDVSAEEWDTPGGIEARKFLDERGIVGPVLVPRPWAAKKDDGR